MPRLPKTLPPKQEPKLGICRYALRLRNEDAPFSFFLLWGDLNQEYSFEFVSAKERRLKLEMAEDKFGIEQSKYSLFEELVSTITNPSSVGPDGV